ncbi:MAG TPA: lyase [Chloroflexota bacterium]|nr:lyase [Chloroflexota bacterium]
MKSQLLLLLLLLAACSSQSAAQRSPGGAEGRAGGNSEAVVSAAPAPGFATGKPVPSPPAASPATAGIPTPAPPPPGPVTPAPKFHEYPVPKGEHPHDVAPTADGMVWYTAQVSGEVGRLDPGTGQAKQIKLGQGSAPHGIIVGPDRALWITDGGLNAIVRVDPATEEVRRFPLPAGQGRADLNTATFNKQGRLWFTGQNGIYGRLEPGSGKIDVFDAPRGRGPYGMTTTKDGGLYFASLAGSYVGRIDPDSSKATILEPATAKQGARRVWADSRGRVWVSEWDGGKLAVYDPANGAWQEFIIGPPDLKAMPYAVYVDERDDVWVSEWRSNELLRYEPSRGVFGSFPFPTERAEVRQLAGRFGEVWGAESGTDKLVVARFGQ